MPNLDAVALAEKALRLGLVTIDQLQEGWEEVGQRGGEADPLLRALERKMHLTPWQSQKLLKNDNDGFFLGGYRILYKIASGSFGRVYRADDPHSGTVVAIKVLRRKWSDDPHNIELFEREGKLGLDLKHPNIVEILAVARDQPSQQYFIAMEFVEGGNLRELLTIRKKLEAPEALRILEDAAAGLAHAYSHGITHRDMKLTNVLINTQGTAKLVDFGLAGVYGQSRAIDTGNVDRTVDYAGIEKATGVMAGDTRSDIYFLGCVGYEILTGRSPLEMTKNARARMNKERFLTVQPMAPGEIKAPASVYRLIETMMMFNPQQRYQTPSQLLEAIREVRREVDGKGSGKSSSPRTIFIVEKDETLQETLRSKFKETGFRVLLAADPVRALDRFRQQSFDVFLVDARTTGDNGIHMFGKLMDEARRHDLFCAGVLLLGDDQKDWVSRVSRGPNITALVNPRLKQLLRTVEELLEHRQ
ncbi:MAG: response regulator [Planctomycetes bacterium]|nr:response regulator [Planctomycetota bacterium]